MSTATMTYSDWIKQNQGLADQALARLAPMPREEPVPAAPAPSQAAPEPSPEPAKTEPPAPAYEAPSAPTPAAASSAKNPTKALDEVRGEQIDAQNETGESFLREGAAKGDAAQKKADTIGGATEKLNRYNAAAEATHEKNREEKDHALEWMKSDMEKLREAPVEPKRWQKAAGIISGIVGATAQAYMGDMGNGVAYGMNALQDLAYKNVRDQLEEKDDAGKNLAHTEKYLDTLEKDSANEMDVASKLSANHWFATSKELERIGEEAKVPEYREAAQRLAIEAESRGRSILENNYKEQIAAAKAAAAARAKAKTDWSQYSVAQLEAWEQSGKLPGAGKEYLIKLRSGDAGIEKTRAETDKLRGEGLPPEPVEVAPGFVASRPLGHSAEAKVSQIYGAGASIKADIARLTEIRRKNKGGTWDREDVKEARGLIATLPSRYSQMFGSGAPNNTELELFGSFLTDPTDYQMTGLDVEESYRRLVNQVDRTAEAQLAGFGVQRVGAAPGAPSGDAPPDIRARPGTAAADPNAPVPMIDTKTGRRFMVPPARVNAARSSGLISEVEWDNPNGVPEEPKPAAPRAPSREEVFAEADYDREERERAERKALGLE
jgi:hypothetical protein